MVFTMLPVSAMAEEAGTPIGVSGEIIDFAPLAETEKLVSTGTPIESLELPESLTATVRTENPDKQGETEPTVDGDTVVNIPVTWKSAPEYDMDIEDVYLFTPVITGYTVSADLPEITVTIAPALPASQAKWGMAKSDGTAPDSWVSSGTLADAMTYANGLTGDTAYIQLLSDVDTTATLEFKRGKTTILDLNGQTIDGTNNDSGPVLYVIGNLTLTDTSSGGAGKITGGKAGSENGKGGGVFVFGEYVSGGTFVPGSFTMKGGNITGNDTSGKGDSSAGGGVYVFQSSFTMEGGAITGNTAKYGGGVFVGSNGSFIMTGGSITENISPYKLGGGVYVSSETLTVGGTAAITDNHTSAEANAPVCNLYLGLHYTGAQSTISVSTATPLVEGAAIGVTAYTKPTASAPVNITGANSSNVIKYFSSDDNTYKIQNSANNVVQLVLGSSTPTTPDVTVTSWDGLKTAIGNAAQDTLTTIAIDGDFNTSTTEYDPIRIGTGKKITLQSASGQSYAITRAAGSRGAFFALSGGGELTLQNITLDGGGAAISPRPYGAMISSIRDGTISRLVLGDGAVLQNNHIDPNERENGGAVRFDGGEITMNGGSAVKNNFSPSNGGGIYVLNSTLTMNGGSITGNSSSGTLGTGGVAVGGNGGTGIFNMKGGSITGNSSSGMHGAGGVSVSMSGQFHLSGGSITGNTSTQFVGGVFLDGSIEQSGGEFPNPGTMTIEGSPAISGNTVGSSASDLYIQGPEGSSEFKPAILQKAGALTTGATVGIFVSGGLRRTILATSEDGIPVSEADKAYFFSNDETKRTIEFQSSPAALIADVKTAPATAPDITTTSLTNGVIGTAYSQTLTATGSKPITWSVESGSSLPGGLSLNAATGVISGTPTVTGTFNYTVKATNSVGSDTKTLSITVTSPITSVSVSPATATVKKTKIQQFTANVSGTASDKSVTWSVSGGSNSTIDQNGLLTVETMETATTLTVKATSKADSSKFGTATVTVAAAPQTYTVTFDSDGGSAVDPISGIEEGKTITLPNPPTKASCRFDGWYTAKNGGGTSFTSGTAVTNSITVYAKWTKLATVAGIVVNYDDTPIQNASVTLSPAYGASAAVTGADGKFSFANIPEDIFTVTAKFSDDSTVTVNVTGDYGNVKIVKPKPYITITTQPKDAILVKIPGQSATFTVQGTRTPSIKDSIGYKWYWLKGATPDTTADEDMGGAGDTMTINQDNGSIPDRGTYKLYGYAYDADAVIDAYSRIATLRVVGVNTIEGVVKNADDTLAEGATVALKYAGGVWPYGSVAMTTSTSTQTTGADGAYKFETVPDGKYKLVITLPGGGQITAGPYDFPKNDPSEPINIEAPEKAGIQISGQPHDATVKNGTAVTLAVDASSTDGTALAYQWYSSTKNSNTGGTKLDGATNASYTPDTANKSTTYYYCVVTGGSLDAATTRAAKITVYTNGTIAGTVQTKEKQPIEGAKVELLNIDTPAQADFTTSTNPQTTLADGKYRFEEVPDGQYKLKITLPGGEIFVVQPINVPNVSPNIPVTPPDKPAISITSQPKNLTVVIHDTAKFTVAAGVSTSGTVLYQWYKNTANRTTGGTAIDGAIGSSYSASTATKGITFYYCVMQANGADAVTSNIAKLTVRNTPLNNLMTIEGNVVDAQTPAQPVEGAVVILSPKAGTSGNPQTTGSNGHYKFENLPDGKYTITVKLPGGGVIEKEIIIEDGEITPTPPSDIPVPADNSITITQQPKSIEVTTDMTASFTAEATAAKASVSYQWYRSTSSTNSGGTKLEGKTDTILNLDKQTEGVSYYYCVVSSTGAADKATDAAKLTVTKAGGNKGNLEGGIVDDNDGKPIAGASVKLMKNGTDGTQFGSTVTTGEDGRFEFAAIPYGSYSLVAEKDAQIITRQIAVKAAETTENLTLPSGGKLTKVIINGSSTPSVATGNLEEMFTTADNTIAEQVGAMVEIKLVVQQQDAPEGKAEIDDALAQDQKVGVYLDATLVKIISGTVADDTVESIQPPAGQTLRIVLDIPADLQGKSGYKILRAHSENGITDTKIIDPDYDRDLQTLSFDADAFSTYAVVYTSSGNNNNGENSNGGSSSYAHYSITATASEGGSISPSGSVSVRERLSQTFIITPGSGYQISGLIVDGKSMEAKNSYTFDNVSANHSIKAVFNKVEPVNPSTGVRFEDVNENDWFYEAVMDAVKNDRFKGTSDNLFSPYLSTERGMIATVLWRMEGEPNSVKPSIFEDVPADAWFHDGVTWANENNEIVKGYGNGLFGPKDTVTRVQIAAILYRYAAFKGYDVSKKTNLDDFKDGSQTSDYAVEAMKWAAANGLLIGKGNGILDPKGHVTRAETAAILTRFNKLFGEK